MPDLLTFLLAELDVKALSVAREQVGADDGSLVPVPQPQDGDRRVVAAEFALAMDATRSALGLVRSIGMTDPSVRVALWTCGGPELRLVQSRSRMAPAVELLTEARPLQVLANASTAVLIGPALPSDVELVDLQRRRPGDHVSLGRIYELRVGGAETPSSNLAWARRAAAGPIVGREAAWASLSSAWKATLGGARRTVVLVGESGIGKTTAAAELALRAHAEDALVLYGRWDRDQVSPYRAIREALSTYGQRVGPTFGQQSDLDEHSDAISRLLPDQWARSSRYRAAAPGHPDGERLELYAAVEAWLSRLARVRPVLVVLDDLQWAERSSLLLVDHLRQAAGTEPWMLVITAREWAPGRDAPPGVAAMLGPADDGAGVEAIELHALDPAAVSLLIEQRLGRSLAPGHEAIERLTAETAGNPLFIHQVLRSLPDAADIAAELLAAHGRLPEQLADVIRWRLRKVTEQTRHVLSDAAIVGSTVDLDLIASAASMTPVAARAALGPALQEELLHTDATSERYTFTHEVVRRALREELEPEHCARVHRRIATALESRADDRGEIDPSEIAYHYLEGADAETAASAVRWARRAAEAARAATGFDEAVRVLTQAVEVHDAFGAAGGSSDNGASGCELRFDLAEAHDLAGQFAARDRRLAEAATLARDLQDSERFTRAALGYGGRLPAGPPPSPIGRRLLEEALDRLPGHDSPERALVLARLAHLRHFDAPHDIRRMLSDEAVALARRLDHPKVLAIVLVARCFALEGPDNVDERLSAGAEVARIGEDTGDADLHLQGIRIRIPALLATGRHHEARELAAACARQAKEIRHRDHLRLATMWDILWAGLAGDHAAAEALAGQLSEQSTRVGHAQAPMLRFAYTFVPRWLHGDLERTRPTLEAFRAAEPDRAVWWALSAWLDAATGHEDAALAQLDQRDPTAFVKGIEHDFMWWPTMISCAVVASCGHPRWAEVLHDVLAAHAGRLAVTGYGLLFGATDHHLGTLALASGRPDEAVALLDTALDSHRALGAVPFVGLTARWLARALTLRAGPGDDERASALGDEAGALADRFDLRGLPRFEDRASRLL